MALQTPREIFEIVQPFAQERIAQTRHAQTHFILHAFDGGFRRQASADGIAHFLPPALVLREQAIGFDHFAALACQIEFARIEHPVDGFAQASDGRFETRQFGLRVVGYHAVLP